MVQQISPREFAEGVLPECRHHWVIQAATGPVSAGICRHCGAVKEFKNYIGATYWGEEKSESLVRPDLPRPAFNSLAEDAEEQ